MCVKPDANSFITVNMTVKMYFPIDYFQIKYYLEQQKRPLMVDSCRYAQ